MTQSPNTASINCDLRGERSNPSADSEAKDQPTTLLSCGPHLQILQVSLSISEVSLT